MLFKAVDQLTGWILSRHRVLCASPLEIHMHTVNAKTHTKQKKWVQQKCYASVAEGQPAVRSLESGFCNQC